PGLGLGYRRNESAGSWVMRVADGAGKNCTRVIGIADDFEEADGQRVLDFWGAQDRARAMARNGNGDAEKPVTIASAMHLYEASLRVRGGDIGNAMRVMAHLSDSLGAKSVASVTTRELRSWRDGLASKLARATVNRTSTVLKAALNFAADHD